MHDWTLRLLAIAGLLFLATRSLAALPLMEGLAVALMGCLAIGGAVHATDALARALRHAPPRHPLPGTPPVPHPDA
ncbi:MAG: hypothetical protein AAF809_11865 [Bacteroidota bacterium]